MSDYAAFLDEFGLSELVLQALAQCEADMAPFPDDVDERFELRESPIHGTGMFSLYTIEAGTVFAPARLDGRRTPGGRFVNHASDPNAMFVADGNDLYLFSARDIRAGEEITLDYRQALKANLESIK